MLHSRQMVLRAGIGALLMVAGLCAQTRPYVASAGTVPQVSVRSIAAGPAIGAQSTGPHVIQPLGALGGAFAGNSISRPLGGGLVVNGPGGSRPGVTRGGHRNVGVLPGRAAVFASYVPSYVEVPVETPSDTIPQPVIINQYFNTPGPPMLGPPGPPMMPAVMGPPPPPEAANAGGSGDLLAPAENYYLIAYRNRSMYAALTWWVEGNTLHYVTTQNTHNQASLDLIDLEMTSKLNQDRNIPFSIPGR